MSAKSGNSGVPSRKKSVFWLKKSVFRFKKSGYLDTQAKEPVESAINREKAGFLVFLMKHAGKTSRIRGEKASSHWVIGRVHEREMPAGEREMAVLRVENAGLRQKTRYFSARNRV